ncbi:MAG: arginine--tRNA ligase, partial [Patescibacteria group bacterium]
MTKEAILAALAQAAQKLGIKAGPSLEFPADLAHGDYSANIAFVSARAMKKNPKALAEEVVKALGKIEGVAKIEVAGPGFINFHLAREYYSSILQKAATSEWGRNEHVKGYKVVVEYSQPNPFKPFHIGHLMSTTIGES